MTIKYEDIISPITGDRTLIGRIVKSKLLYTEQQQEFTESWIVIPVDDQLVRTSAVETFKTTKDARVYLQKLWKKHHNRKEGAILHLNIKIEGCTTDDLLFALRKIDYSLKFGLDSGEGKYQTGKYYFDIKRNTKTN